MGKIESFIRKYNLIILFGFMLLTMQTYVFQSLTINMTLGVIYRGIVALLITAYVALFICCFKIKPSKLFIVLSIIYIFSSIISLIINPIIAKTAFSFVQYLASVTTIFFNVLSIYLFMVSYKINDRSKQELFLLIFMCFTCFLCLFTYIFQFKNIYETLTNKYGWNYDVTSIFYIKTIYGFILTMGSIYAVLYWIQRKNVYILLLPPFFLINAFISRNKTSILIIGLLILFTVICLLHNLSKTSWKRFIIVLSSILVFISIIIILILVIPFLKQFVQGSIINDGIVVLKARVDKWGLFFKNFRNIFNIIFGYGERISRALLGDYNVSDNIYLFSLATGGIIKLLIHIFLITIIIRKILKTKNYKLLLLVVLILISGIFEENYIYGFNLFSLASAPLIYICGNQTKE